MISKKRILAVFTASGLALSLMSAPALASKAEDGPVTQLGKCSSRNKIAYGDGSVKKKEKGLEFKCSIAGGGLKWKRTGNKQGSASTSSSASTQDTAKFANVTGTIKIDGSSTVAPLTGVAAEHSRKFQRHRSLLVFQELVRSDSFL